MSRVCQVTGKQALVGNRVSHSKRRTKKRSEVNLRNKRFWFEEEKRYVSLRVSARGMKTIDKRGLVLNSAQTWHQLRPGEMRVNCGGCHVLRQEQWEFDYAEETFEDSSEIVDHGAESLAHITEAALETWIGGVQLRGVQRQPERREPEVGQDPGGGPQADRLAGAAVVVDHRTARCLDDLDLLVGAAADPDPFGVDGRRCPAGRLADQQPVAGAPQPFAVEVLVVGHRVGDRPGDLAGMTEMGDARNAGHGEPEHVVLRTGETDLLVDAGRFDDPVRITADQGGPGGGAVGGEQPAVAARGDVVVGGEQAGGLRLAALATSPSPQGVDARGLCAGGVDEIVEPFVGASADDLVFVDNVTEGANAVLRSWPKRCDASGLHGGGPGAGTGGARGRRPA